MKANTPGRTAQYMALFRAIETKRSKGKRLFVNLKNNQEQWTFGFNPGEIATFLQHYDRTLSEDKNATAYRSIYMPERKGFLEGYEFYRVAIAKK